MEPVKRDNSNLAYTWFGKYILIGDICFPFNLLFILCSEHNKKLRLPETKNRKKPGTLIPLWS
jgi:hypothetical protein